MVEKFVFQLPSCAQTIDLPPIASATEPFVPPPGIDDEDDEVVQPQVVEPEAVVEPEVVGHPDEEEPEVIESVEILGRNYTHTNKPEKETAEPADPFADFFVEPVEIKPQRQISQEQLQFKNLDSALQYLDSDTREFDALNEHDSTIIKTLDEIIRLGTIIENKSLTAVRTQEEYRRLFDIHTTLNEYIKTAHEKATSLPTELFSVGVNIIRALDAVVEMVNSRMTEFAGALQAWEASKIKPLTSKHLPAKDIFIRHLTQKIILANKYKTRKKGEEFQEVEGKEAAEKQAEEYYQLFEKQRQWAVNTYNLDERTVEALNVLIREFITNQILDEDRTVEDLGTYVKLSAASLKAAREIPQMNKILKQRREDALSGNVLSEMIVEEDKNAPENPEDAEDDVDRIKQGEPIKIYEDDFLIWGPLLENTKIAGMIEATPMNSRRLREMPEWKKDYNLIKFKSNHLYNCFLEIKKLTEKAPAGRVMTDLDPFKQNLDFDKQCEELGEKVQDYFSKLMSLLIKYQIKEKQYCEEHHKPLDISKGLLGACTAVFVFSRSAIKVLHNLSPESVVSDEQAANLLVGNGFGVTGGGKDNTAKDRKARQRALRSSAWLASTALYYERIKKSPEALSSLRKARKINKNKWLERTENAFWHTIYKRSDARIGSEINGWAEYMTAPEPGINDDTAKERLKNKKAEIEKKHYEHIKMVVDALNAPNVAVEELKERIVLSDSQKLMFLEKAIKQEQQKLAKYLEYGMSDRCVHRIRAENTQNPRAPRKCMSPREIHPGRAAELQAHIKSLPAKYKAIFEGKPISNEPAAATSTVSVPAAPAKKLTVRQRIQQALKELNISDQENVITKLLRTNHDEDENERQRVVLEWLNKILTAVKNKVRKPSDAKQDVISVTQSRIISTSGITQSIDFYSRMLEAEEESKASTASFRLKLLEKLAKEVNNGWV